MNHVFTLLSGLIFGFGLALSGMTHPEKVLGFLDVSGQWNPSLLFVLGGAVSVTLVCFYYIRKLPKPLIASSFRFAEARKIDSPLIVGSALFGIGWGISGYCPGPAVALLAAPSWELLVFLPAMLAGYAIQKFFEQRSKPELAAIEKPTEPSSCG